ncbi:prepilin-type N-terminal cleavage/methylation domain-containing protein [Helicobacter cholecystus]|uniref:Prepilin-type N-terminal cleavage/methylation domain-containing protein n=1 Tax=Helicobacter cholecystus TaxID=45498 RepID=A0A3D8IXB7_9HELI|nr:prepilin-type N-terminal cleavage/methylation domain-containing protein [Helicobacter cholecystus]RDU69902.1 prepilin-type N-terminal cleavage/methylation domain-containing protein [Helicobacter cholecystus]VEJ25054.1 Tfp pilus assembly protein PilE [Helicobacter cholecystus]
MRRAFSMLELVFVIVILGILASIAIPKFSSTRSEAEAVSIQADLTQTLSAIQREVFVKNLSANAINADTMIQIAGLNKSRWIAVGNQIKLAKNGSIDHDNDCISLEFANQKDLVLEITSLPSSALCEKLNKTYESKIIPLITH